MAGRTELLALHALRLRSLCPAPVVADRFGLDLAEVEAVLAEAASLGRVRHRDGRLSGWSLTGEGRRHAEGLLTDELDRSGARHDVAAAYIEFLELNPLALAVCTDWQVCETSDGPVANDHGDAERDAQVLRRLDDLHARVLPVTAALAAALDRLGGYGERLSHAHARVVAGDTEWLTRPMIDSYHTVWFELHEDLLATLGRSRSDEQHQSAQTDPARGGVAEEYA